VTEEDCVKPYPSMSVTCNHLCISCDVRLFLSHVITCTSCDVILCKSLSVNLNHVCVVMCRKFKLTGLSLAISVRREFYIRSYSCSFVYLIIFLKKSISKYCLNQFPQTINRRDGYYASNRFISSPEEDEVKRLEQIPV
jgi:hypothetical protein